MDQIRPHRGRERQRNRVPADRSPMPPASQTVRTLRDYTTGLFEALVRAQTVSVLAQEKAEAVGGFDTQ